MNTDKHRLNASSVFICVHLWFHKPSLCAP
jgi:hypothetical protein